MREAVAILVSTYVWTWLSPATTVAVNILKYRRFHLLQITYV